MKLALVWHMPDFIGIFLEWLGSVAALISSLTPGDWPTGIGAAFAGAAALLALKTLRSQQRETRKRNTFDRRRQASQIVAWIESIESTAPFTGSSFGSGSQRKMLRVVNPSGTPVFSVEIDVYSEEGEILVRWPQSLLPPLEGFRDMEISEYVFEKGECSVSICFVDADGVAWNRDRKNHQLSEDNAS